MAVVKTERGPPGATCATINMRWPGLRLSVFRFPGHYLGFRIYSLGFRA